MGYRNFSEMIKAVKAKNKRKRCAVVCADSRHTLEAVFSAFRDGIIEPLLIGDEYGIRGCIEEIGEGAGEVKIIPAESSEEAVQKMISLVRNGQADMVMKGRVETSVLMKAVLNKRNDLRTGKTVSVFTSIEIPTYHKILTATDGGLIIYPDLDQKKHIIENAVGALRMMGTPCPKVAVLAASEFLDPKVVESVDARALKEMNLRGEIRDCIIEGPISYDLAINKRSAELKGFDSLVAGDADLLVWPNMVCGNITGKALALSERGKEASIVLGAKIPIILPSRGLDADEKYRAIALASAVD